MIELRHKERGTQQLSKLRNEVINIKKHTCKHNGKNIFAQPARRKVIEINKETAMDQLVEILASLDANDDGTQYTMVFYDFTDKEQMEFDKKMVQLITLRSKIRGRGYAISFVTTLPNVR